MTSMMTWLIRLCVPSSTPLASAVPHDPEPSTASRYGMSGLAVGAALLGRGRAEIGTGGGLLADLGDEVADPVHEHEAEVAEQALRELLAPVRGHVHRLPD